MTKLMVIGHARHGKDTACNLLSQLYGLTFISSSWFVGEKAVRPALEKIGLIYPSMDACYQDRHNHRDKWHNAIRDYNAGDPGRLGRELYEKYDIYCGLRNQEEFRALQYSKVFDVSFWIDRSDFVDPEDISSMTIRKYEADYIIDNNSSIHDLMINLIDAMEYFMELGTIEKLRHRYVSHTS